MCPSTPPTFFPSGPSKQQGLFSVPQDQKAMSLSRPGPLRDLKGQFGQVNIRVLTTSPNACLKTLVFHWNIWSWVFHPKLRLRSAMALQRKGAHGDRKVSRPSHKLMLFSSVALLAQVGPKGPTPATLVKQKDRGNTLGFLSSVLPRP